MARNTTIESASPSASPSERAEDAEDERVEQQRLQRLVRVAPLRRRLSTRSRRNGAVTSIALNANMKPDERADRREQLLALVGRRSGGVEQLRVEVRRLDVQMPRRQPLEARSTSRSRPGSACTKIRVTRPRMPLSSCA